MYLTDIAFQVTVTLSLTICFVLFLRRILRRVGGSSAAYTLWLIPAAAFVVEAFAPRPTGPTIWLQNTSSLTSSVASSVVESVQAPNLVVLTVWLIGIVVSVLVLAVRQYCFNPRLSDAEKIAEIESIEIFRCRKINTAIALGLWRPRIVVPWDFAGFNSLHEPRSVDELSQSRLSETQRLVLRHELVHITRQDTRLNVVAELLRCIFWFNPIVHLGIHCMRLDQEAACDQRVLLSSPHLRHTYATALIDSATPGFRFGTFNSWASPKRQLAKRINGVMRRPHKKTSRIAGVSIALACAVHVGILTYAELPNAQSQRLSWQQHADVIPRMSQTELGKNLLYAVQVGNYKLAQTLLSSGAPVDYEVDSLGTPLILAARLGRQNFAELLLDHNADVNASVVSAGSPLIMAAKYNHFDMAELLLDRGSDVNAHVFLDETPLINASRFGHVEMVERLIDAGADIQKSVVTFSTTHLPLGIKSATSEAIRVGHDQVLQVLNRRKN